MDEVGLVLQGGGMRGVYTSGVLDFFLDKNLYFPYVIGVSAGACNGAAYLARQRGLGKIIHTKYINDPRYVSLRNLYTTGTLFGMDFIFEEIPRNLESFDYKQFYNQKCNFVVVATNCITGKPEYFQKSTCKDIFYAIRASSSLPFIGKIVKLEGVPLLDGGISDPLPVKKAVDDGCKKVVVILTQPLAHQKKSTFLSWLAKKLYFQYEGLCDTLCNSHYYHNEAIHIIQDMEKKGKVMVIAPVQPIKIKNIERNPIKLNQIYEMGYKDAHTCYEDITSWIGSNTI